MSKPNERGIALVMALFLTAVMSVLAASLMFLSQTETYASMNYRMMTQARYSGEAGIQKAADFLLDSTRYTIPGYAGDPLSDYLRTTSPVICVSGCANLNQPVVLSSYSGVASNYPVASVITAFNNSTTGATGSLAAGFANLTYTSYATLMSMQTFDSYGGGQAVIQTWQITGIGALSGVRSAQVQVSATIEQPKVSANSYAAFATADACNAMYFHGNVTVDSYDSTEGPYSTSQSDTGGDVGTNGNLHVQGSVDVEGHLYTPQQGVGSCTSGAITGLTEGGSATVADGMVNLPAQITYPTPTFTTTPPTTQVTINSSLIGTGATAACSALGLTYGTQITTPTGNCDLKNSSGGSASLGAAGPYTNVVVDNYGIGDVTMPSVVIGSGYTLTMTGQPGPGQTVNINSLTGSGNFAIDANLSANNGDSVVLKINGLNADGTQMTTPLDFSTITWKQNSSGNAENASALQIDYGGTASLSMPGGNSQSAATIYAPNAAFTMIGTQDWYGSILANTITNGGNASIHYDRRLSRDYYVAGHPMLGAFTWKRN